MSRVYFFGCWNDSGHFLFAPGGRLVRYAERRPVEVVDGIHLDGNYAPRTHRRGAHLCWSAQARTVEDRNRLTHLSDEQPQGRFLRHQRGGFTLISWWDRTQGDTRPGCNSTFLLEGDHDTATMLTELRACFPGIVANLARAGVELIEVAP